MGASFILAINLALGAAVMLSFLAFGFYDRSQKAALWWFAACLAGVLAGAIEYSVPSAEYTAIARFLIFTIFAVSVCCLSIGLSLRYAGRIPWVPIAIGFIASVICYLSIAELPRSSLTRNIFYQLPYAGLQLIGLYFVLRGMSRSLLDRAVVAGLIFNIAQYLMRPPMVVLFGGSGPTAQEYLGTDYAMASQTLMAIATIVVAFLLGIRMLADVLDKMQSKSEIDRLSGMLTRDGYRRLINLTLAPRNRNGAPMALVLCDLDHFKKVNDTYGHPVGDEVIAAFGHLLGEAKRPADLMGRIGGEEFCILLRNSNGTGGRLFAEQLRSTFETIDIGDAPPRRGFTASFGVTEIGADEEFDNAFSRADRALYRAKRTGRNRVILLLPNEEAANDRPPASDHSSGAVRFRV